MAVVMLALNGEGLGHLIRSTLVSQALMAVGERPVIFSQGMYQAKGTAVFPGRTVPSLWRAPQQVRERVASDLYTMAAISLPAVLVEDTHPNPIELPREVRRVLMVRPTSFEYLLRLNQHYGATYSTFLLCDSPESPTWPYDAAQSAVLASWSKWNVVGPIYRTASLTEIEDVRSRYGLSPGQDLCVFTMGGGGVHDSNDHDVDRFLALSTEVAGHVQMVNPDTRLVFVQGPYFPRDAVVPSRFEVVRDEKEMPALLKLARGAVIRAGFNTTWECLAAGTPMVPLIGTTFAEPVPERLSRLRSLGLLPSDLDDFWTAQAWRDRYARTAREITLRHPRVPDAHLLQRLIVGQHPSPSRLRPGASRGLAKSQQKVIPFIIRIDDVTCTEPGFCWLLELLASRGLCASLEVVPYLVDFDQGVLDQVDPGNNLFEVSQHGYAHVPRTAETGRRCEYLPESKSPTEEELTLLQQGKNQLERLFSRRFTGGFSPPFDALPIWLPDAWRQLGGKFVSCLYTSDTGREPLPLVRAGVDVWDWRMDRGLTRSRLQFKLHRQFGIDGYVGIVLHPRCLRSRTDQHRLVSLLNYIERRGGGPVSLQDLAQGKVQLAKTKLSNWTQWVGELFTGGQTGFH